MGTAVAKAPRAGGCGQSRHCEPLLEDIHSGAQGILINCGSSSLSLHEVHEASSVIQKAAHENRTLFWRGMDENMRMR